MTVKQSQLWLGLTVALLCVPGGALGQELRGRIMGVVTDQSGAVVPGATVTATSPALIQPRTVTTDGNGNYSFPALPSGLYTVTFELSGFKSVRREQIRLTLDVTLTVDATIEMSSLTDTITIVAASPVVDSTTTALGTSFTKELLTDIPNARDLWAALAQAPGMQMRGYDVGGSHTGTQTAYVAYGLEQHHRTYVEGVNVTESRNANSGYFDYGSMEEFQVGAGGNMGEGAVPGALLNFTVKSGGDVFGGQMYADYQDENTIGDNVPDALRQGGAMDEDGFRAPAQGLETGNPVVQQYDLNGGIGGPIIRRKAWFFGSYRLNQQDARILGIPQLSETKLENFSVKGTYALNTNNNLIVFFNKRLKLQPLRDISLVRPEESAYYQESRMRIMKLEWTSVVSNRTFFNVLVGQNRVFSTRWPTQTQSRSVEGVPVGRLERTTNQQSGATSSYQDDLALRPQVSGRLSHFRGNHTFNAGFEIFRQGSELLRFQPGNIYYYDRNGIPEEVDIYNTPNTALNYNDSQALYVQDQWSLGTKITLNLGLRYDHYSLGWPEQSYTPEQSAFFSPVSTSANTVVSWHSVAPRIGVAWDVTGAGKTVVKAFAGRFFIDPHNQISSVENPVGQAALRYQFLDANRNGVVDSASELGRLLQTVGGAGFVTVDPGIKHPYGDEVSLHLERELLPSLSLRGSYVYKGTRRMDAEVDRARIDAYTIPFNFVDVGEDNVRGTPDDQVISLFDRPANTPSDRVLTNAPDNDGDYQTLEVAANRRALGRWMLLSSVAYTWSNDFRASTSQTGAAAAISHSNSYSWQPNLRRFGRQDTSFWHYKIVGRYDFGHGIASALSYKLQSGYNFNRSISVALPNAGTEAVAAHPIEDDRAPSVGIFDIRFEKKFDLGAPTRDLSFMVDVFNTFNSNPVVNFRTVSGSRYKEVIAILDPRVVRFGVRYSF
jgi:outer membrane receptor protein involved in Fe transport